MEEVVMKEVETYVEILQNTSAGSIQIRLVMDLCLVAAWHPEARGLRRWWEQEGLDLEDIRKAERAMEAERDLG